MCRRYILGTVGMPGGCVPGWLVIVNYCFVGFYSLEAFVTWTFWRNARALGSISYSCFVEPHLLQQKSVREAHTSPWLTISGEFFVRFHGFGFYVGVIVVIVLCQNQGNHFCLQIPRAARSLDTVRFMHRTHGLGGHAGLCDSHHGPLTTVYNHAVSYCTVVYDM